MRETALVRLLRAVKDEIGAVGNAGPSALGEACTLYVALYVVGKIGDALLEKVGAGEGADELATTRAHLQELAAPLVAQVRGELGV